MKRAEVKIKPNRLFIRITNLLCIVCIIVMMLITLPSISIAHAEHEHDIDLVCRNTGISECKCDDNDKSRFENIAYNGFQSFAETGHNIEIIDDCYGCILIHKTVSQQRLSFVTVSSAIPLDISICGNDHSGCEHIQSISLTPVELRTKLSN